MPYAFQTVSLRRDTPTASLTNLGLPATYPCALFSAWFTIPSGATGFQFGNSAGGVTGFDFEALTTGPSVTLGNASNHLIGDVIAGGGLPSPGQLVHVLASVDAPNNRMQIYLNDAPVAFTPIWFNTDPIGRPPGQILQLNGSVPGFINSCLGNVWFSSQASFTDLSVTANRRKFINADLTPADVGSNGQTPFGSPPPVFLHCAVGGAAADFVANLGTGGAFGPVLPFGVCGTVPLAASPVVAPDFAFTMDEDTTLAAAVVATGPASIVYSIVTPPTHSPYTFNADGTFVYDATRSFSGVDTFVYRATDASDPANYAQGTVTITVLNAFPLGVSKVLLPSAELQFCDSNGAPYAGGTLETLVVDTTTPKDTWKDANGSAENTNPIVLDAAGRCIVFGDGAYRTILRDALGNEIWDKNSYTYVSVAMTPVVGAPTIAEAVRLLGIADMIAAEADARVAGDAAEAAARTAAIAAEAAARDAAIAVETSRAEAAEAALGGRIDGLPAPAKVQGGDGVTGADGHVRITFAAPFTSACTGFAVTTRGISGPIAQVAGEADRTGADCWSTFPGTSTAASGVGFSWIATGN